MRFALLLGVGVLLSSDVVAAASPAPNSVLVMRLKPLNGVTADATEILTSLLAGQVDELKIYDEVVDLVEYNARLGLELAKDAVGCSDVACAAEIGGALNANHIIHGSVGKLGKQIVIDLVLQNSRGVVLGRGKAFVPADESLYSAGMVEAVSKLFKRPVAHSPPAEPPPPPPRVAERPTAPAEPMPEESWPREPHPQPSRPRASEATEQRSYDAPATIKSPSGMQILTGVVGIGALVTSGVLELVAWRMAVRLEDPTYAGAQVDAEQGPQLQKAAVTAVTLGAAAVGGALLWWLTDKTTAPVAWAPIVHPQGLGMQFTHAF